MEKRIFNILKKAYDSRQFLLKVLYRKVGNKRYMHDLEKLLAKLELSEQDHQTLMFLARDLNE